MLDDNYHVLLSIIYVNMLGQDFPRFTCSAYLGSKHSSIYPSSQTTHISEHCQQLTFW